MLVLVSKSGKGRVEEKLNTAVNGTDTELVWEIFNGECSKGEVERIRKTVEEQKCDIVVGLGSCLLCKYLRCMLPHVRIHGRSLLRIESTLHR